MPLAVIHSRDPDGREVVSVPLNNRSDRAKLYREDFERITSGRRQHASWFLNDNGCGHVYVRLKDPETRNNVMVARLVTGDPPGRIIRHRNGDRLDLRSTNLDVCRPKRREGVWDFRVAPWSASATSSAAP